MFTRAIDDIGLQYVTSDATLNEYCATTEGLVPWCATVGDDACRLAVTTLAAMQRL
jgi:hypothetical protein